MAFIRWRMLVVVVPLLVVLLGTPTRAKLLEPGWIKTTVVEKISEMTGRELVIEGNFEVDLVTWTPRLHAEGVRFANAPWGEEPYLLQAKEVTFTLDLRSLLKGRLVLPEVKLIAPRILLETSPQGQGNWELNPTAQKPASPSGFKIPMIGHLMIQDGRLVYRDLPKASAFEVRLDTATGQLQQEEMMTLKAQGRLQGQPLKVTFKGGSLLAFRAPDRPYPLTLQIDLGKTTARLEGTIAQPETLTGVDLAVALQGESLGFLAPFLEKPLPESLPYRLQGQLLNPDGSTWILEQFDSQLGNTDLKGDFTLDTSGKRPAISADLVSRTLDVNQLLTVWSAAGSTQPSPAATTASEPHHVLERVIDLQPLRQLDADVQLQADQLMAPQLTLNQALLNLSLQNGRLHLAPLRVALPEGRLEAELRLDARRPLRSFLQAGLEQIDLGQALKAVSPKAAELGTLDGRLHLSLAPKPFDEPLTPAKLIERLRLRDSRLNYRDPKTSTQLTGNLKTVETAANQSRLAIEGRGRYQDQPVQLAFNTDPLLELSQSSEPFSMAGHLEVAGHRAQIDTTLNNPPALEDWRMAIALKGDQPAKLGPLMGITLPDLPPYQLHAQVYHQENTWQVRQLNAELGDSDLSGEMTFVNKPNQRPLLTAELSARKLDLKPLTSSWRQDA